MAKISLRAYNREIESLIDQGQRLEEAIAHCHHILASYSKHLDTYRLLGKAYLEARRHDEAVDVFQRVLVASPGDFVSHVGMSIIADERGELDEAIWHMERAFEVQPSNAAIQAELQRLFGRRDGVEPPRIRLTRGALAHMYVQGQLYTQAVSEIRSVLAHDPNRTDMLELLAWAHFRNGQKAETADVCSSLLALSPYCLDANRLMAEITPGLQAADAMGEYRRRVVQLDPYAEFAEASTLTADAVPDDTIMLQRLEYVRRSSAVESGPALGLASTLGAAEPSDIVPSWLSSPSDVAAPGEDDIPAFLRKGTMRDAIGAEVNTPRTEAGISGIASAGLAGELPEWVRASIPTEGAEPPSVSAAGPDAPGRLVGSEKYDQPGSSAEPDIGAVDETPDWLGDATVASDEPFESPSHADLAPGADQADSIGGDRIGTDQAATDGEAGELARSDELAARDGELFPSPGWPAGTQPDWVEQTPRSEMRVPAAWKPLADVSNDSTALGADSGTDARPEDTPKSLDWLNAGAEVDVSAGMEEQTATELPPLMAEREPAPWSQSPPRTGNPIPDWLGARPGTSTEAESGTARELSGEFESEVGLPDWLADLDTERRTSAYAPTEEGPAERSPEWSRADTPGARGSAGPASNWQRIEQTAEASQDLEFNQEPVRNAVARLAAGNSPGPVQRLREPIPLGNRPVPETSEAGMSSLGGAKAELGRGNLAAAMDIYGRFIRKGKFLEEIVRDLRDALHRYPVEVSIWQALGDAYIRANRIQEALDAYTKAEELLR